MEITFKLTVAISVKQDTILQNRIISSNVLSSRVTNFKNDIQKFPQLFDE